MTNQQLNEALFCAALKAGREMGPAIKDLSCFVSNWPKLEECEVCDAMDGDIRLEDSRTQYVWKGDFDDPENPNRPLMLCRECAREHHEYWDERWSDYYGGLL